MEQKSIPHNPLIHRLYKNFSESKQPPKNFVAKDLSILNESSIKSKNVLIPIFQSQIRQPLRDSSLRKISVI